MTKEDKNSGILLPQLILAGSLILFYWSYLIAPGTLYARVVRDFWPIYHTWPYFELSKRIFAEWHFPLWNPLNAGGTPLLGCMQPAPFHPARIIMFLFPFWKIIDIWLVLRVFLSGTGTYWFLRKRGSGWQGALLGASAWMYCGSVTDYINLHYLDIDLMLPYGLLAFGWMARSNRVTPIVTCALLIFLAFLGGNPTSALFLLLFTSSYYFYSVYRLREDVSGSWARFLAAACVSGLISSVVLLPFREMLAYSWDYHPPGLIPSALDFHFILSLFGPEAYPGVASTSMPLIQRMPYVGTVVLILALPGFFHLRRMGSSASFFAAFAVFFTGVIWGIMPFRFFSYIPLFIRTSNFRYAMPVVSFCIALLAGLSWDYFTHEKRSIRNVFILPLALTLAGAMLVLLKHAGLLTVPINGMGIVILCAFAWAATFILVLYSRELISSLPACILLLSIWFFEASIHFRYLPLLAPGNPSHWQNPPLSDAEHSKGSRIYATEGLLYPNTNLVHGIEDIRYFGALYVSSYREFMSVLNAQNEIEALNDFIPNNYISILPGRLESSLLDLAGVDSIYSEFALPSNRLIGKILRNGEIKPDKKGHVLERKMSIASKRRDVLYQHPPSFISINIPEGDLSFGIAIDPAQWSQGRDGVTFMVLKRQKDVYRSIFARHIDPSNNPRERRWFDYTISDTGGELVFMTLPGDDFTGDWSAWGELRSTGVEGVTRYKLIDEKTTNIYRNPSAMPRAFLVSEVVIKGEGECTEYSHKRMDYEKTACLEGMQAYEARSGLGKSTDHKVEWKRPAHDKTIVNVETDRKKLLVLTETYYPGWKAFLDESAEIMIYPADGMFRAIPVPAGKHKISFIYKPATFRVGLWVTFVSLLVMAAVYVKRIREE